MKVCETEQVVCIDCDDTLVMWNLEDTTNNIPFPDPYLKGLTNFLTPNDPHIELLKKHKSRGYTVIVWSAAGFKWAETVVKVLGLESFVDLVLSKPAKYIDDLPCQEWMGHRVYIK